MIFIELFGVRMILDCFILCVGKGRLGKIINGIRKIRAKMGWIWKGISKKPPQPPSLLIPTSYTVTT
jgi:hypothetical protein